MNSQESPLKQAYLLFSPTTFYALPTFLLLIFFFSYVFAKNIMQHEDINWLKFGYG